MQVIKTGVVSAEASSLDGLQSVVQTETPFDEILILALQKAIVSKAVLSGNQKGVPVAQGILTISGSSQEEQVPLVQGNGENAAEPPPVLGDAEEKKPDQPAREVSPLGIVEQQVLPDSIHMPGQDVGLFSAWGDQGLLFESGIVPSGTTGDSLVRLELTGKSGQKEDAFNYVTLSSIGSSFGEVSSPGVLPEAERLPVAGFIAPPEQADLQVPEGIVRDTGNGSEKDESPAVGIPTTPDKKAALQGTPALVGDAAAGLSQNTATPTTPVEKVALQGALSLVRDAAVGFSKNTAPESGAVVYKVLAGESGLPLSVVGPYGDEPALATGEKEPQISGVPARDAASDLISSQPALPLEQVGVVSVDPGEGSQAFLRGKALVPETIVLSAEVDPTFALMEAPDLSIQGEGIFPAEARPLVEERGDREGAASIPVKGLPSVQGLSNQVASIMKPLVHWTNLTGQADGFMAGVFRSGNLGHVLVETFLDGEGLHGTFTVANEQAGSVLEALLPQIQRSLAAMDGPLAEMVVLVQPEKGMKGTAVINSENLLNNEGIAGAATLKVELPGRSPGKEAGDPALPQGDGGVLGASSKRTNELEQRVPGVQGQGSSFDEGVERDYPVKTPVASVATELTSGGKVNGATTTPGSEASSFQRLYREVAESLKPMVQWARFHETGGGRLEVALKPEKLGQLWFEISRVGEKLIATFVVENQQVARVLESNIPQLRQALSQGGVSWGDVTITVGQNPNFGGEAGGGYRRREQRRMMQSAYPVESGAGSAVNKWRSLASGRVDLLA